MAVVGPTVAIARPAPSFAPGYDVSYPQCGLTLPSPAAFAVVGVNGGKDGTRNHCLKKELAWAKKFSGVNAQPAVSLYVNTDDPGTQSSNWPKNSVDLQSGDPVRDRYGSCSGGDTQACAWQYGWNMAERDERRDGVTSPLSYAWWLDAEATNTWQSDRRLNRADLTGMADYFQTLGVKVGLYSTWLQWPQIVGAITAPSPLLGLPEWVTGSSTEANAEASCWQDQFMPGGDIVLSQWYTSSSLFDGDVTCPASGFRRIRVEY